MSTVTAIPEPAAEKNGAALSPLRRGPLAAVSGGAAAVFLLLSGGQGYYVDELYFRVAAGHLDWGYVDQPPLIPLLARVQMALFGDNLVAIRVVPALLAGVAVLVAGFIARELGGGGRAQVLAACATAGSLASFAAGHVLHPTAVDHLVWVTACWLVIRVIRTGEKRLWPVAGAVVGIGLLAKYLVVLLVICLAAGLLVTGPRRVLRSGYLLAGAGVAALVAAPGLVWQALNGWPQFAVAGSLSEPFGVGSVINFFVGQILMIGPFLTPVWVVGLLALLRRPEWRAYRSLAVAYPVMVVILLLAGGAPRYTEGLLTVLLVAGCVRAATWAATIPRRIWVGLAVAGNTLLAMVMVMPVLPAAVYARDPVLAALGEEQFGQTGWQGLAGQVAAVYRSLPEADRARAVVYGHNYGEAGAVALYGPGYGLPREYSGNNSYADFGRPADDKTVVIAVGVDRASFSRLFGRCELGGTLDFEFPHFEQGKEILVCRDPREPWSRIWPELRWLGTF
ncbi:glycosyltransferase family 39 protein [Streptosporangium amethystogenes subsp. fukuiense]|uniref:Glycosyltransferase family 39 protein n=2 Tax=Streptosporangium amethystogenes TaxID=2002 RepID=A0ABW2SSK7_9ACTN